MPYVDRSRLHDVCIPELAHVHRQTSGIDSLAHSRDRKHFLQFPLSITYEYNSRGFRDLEWPTNLEGAVWCVGDSFTVGLGVPFDYTWPQQLRSYCHQPVISVAMDGAGNQWISRMAKTIILHARPAALAIMWSYAHRRESLNTTVTAMQRRLHHDMHFDMVADYDLFEQSVSALYGCRIVHAVVPNFHKLQSAQAIWNQVKGVDWPDQIPLNSSHIPTTIIDELISIHDLAEMPDLIDLYHRFQNFKTQHRWIEYEVIDLARDGHHFGCETSRRLGQQFGSTIAVP